MLMNELSESEYKKFNFVQILDTDAFDYDYHNKNVDYLKKYKIFKCVNQFVHFQTYDSGRNLPNCLGQEKST